MLKSKIILDLTRKGFPKFVAYEEGAPGYVYINRGQYFEGVPKEVWEFHVGGYRVCEKVAQGPAWQAAILRRSDALSEGGGGLEGDGTADGRDRPGHSRLADRVRKLSHLLLCDTDDGRIHLRVKSGRLCRTNSFLRHG